MTTNHKYCSIELTYMNKWSTFLSRRSILHLSKKTVNCTSTILSRIKKQPFLLVKIIKTNSINLVKISHILKFPTSQQQQLRKKKKKQTRMKLLQISKALRYKLFNKKTLIWILIIKKHTHKPKKWIRNIQMLKQQKIGLHRMSVIEILEKAISPRHKTCYCKISCLWQQHRITHLIICNFQLSHICFTTLKQIVVERITNFHSLTS